MTTFRDGPAEGVFLSLRRSPLYIRVVRNQVGEWDALDQLDDTPAAGETLFAYRLDGEPVVAMVDGVRNGRRCGWREVMAWYDVVAEQPDRDVMANTAEWRAWCVERQKAEVTT
jgi:hypothetical protein